MCYGTAYIILDRTGTAYAFYEREKTEEKNKKQRKQIEGASPQEMWHTLEKNELKKQHHCI